jgi:hypothetical protein
MAYKYYIKGVRKFNDEKVAEKVETLFLSEDEGYNRVTCITAWINRKS